MNLFDELLFVQLSKECFWSDIVNNMSKIKGLPEDIKTANELLERAALEYGRKNNCLRDFEKCKKNARIELLEKLGKYVSGQPKYTIAIKIIHCGYKCYFDVIKNEIISGFIYKIEYETKFSQYAKENDFFIRDSRIVFREYILDDFRRARLENKSGH